MENHAHEQCCAGGRRNAKVNYVSSEEIGKMAFAIVDTDELNQCHSSEISALLVTL